MNRPLRHPPRISSPVLRIGLLTPHDPFDLRAFSGTAFFAARALGDRADLRLATPGHAAPTALDRILGRRARAVTAAAFDELDAVVGLVATECLDRPDLPPDLPVIHVTDATPAFLRETYGWDIPQGADAAEARVLARADVAVYSSDAMARRAARDFGARPAVLPFGINLPSRPGTCPEKPPLDRIELVLVASEWDRKGGPLALAVLDRLAALGRRAHLTVIGQSPRHLGRRDDVTCLGWLDKTKARDLRRLTAAFSRAHLALVPSRADCTPMTVAEAMAHGTPVIASDTGGMATLLPPRGPGLRLAPDAGVADWTRAILDLTSDDWAHAAMCLDAFRDARDRLSWEAWADGIVRLVRGRLARAAPQAA